MHLLTMGPPSKMGLTTAMVGERGAEAMLARQGTVKIGNMLALKPMVTAAALAQRMTGAPLTMRMTTSLVPQEEASHLESAFLYCETCPGILFTWFMKCDFS